MPGKSDEYGEPFSPVGKKKAKKRAAQRRLEEEAELRRVKAEEEMEKRRLDQEAESRRAMSDEERARMRPGREAVLEQRRANERSAEADRIAAKDVAATGGRKRDAVGRQGLDQVKGGISDVYVVRENIMSAPKKVKLEVQDRIVPAQYEGDSVSEGVSVLQEMQKVTRDLQGLLFSDANKVPKFIIDKILDQARKYETIISKVNLENECLHGRAEVQDRMYQQLKSVSENVNQISEKVCRVHNVCEELSARPAYVPGAAGQGSGSASQPRSYAVIVRGADEQMTTGEVKRRMDEAVRTEVDVRVRGVRSAPGGGGGCRYPYNKCSGP